MCCDADPVGLRAACRRERCVCPARATVSGAGSIASPQPPRSAPTHPGVRARSPSSAARLPAGRRVPDPAERDQARPGLAACSSPEAPNWACNASTVARRYSARISADRRTCGTRAPDGSYWTPQRRASSTPTPTEPYWPPRVCEAAPGGASRDRLRAETHMCALHRTTPACASPGHGPRQRTGWLVCRCLLAGKCLSGIAI